MRELIIAVFAFLQLASHMLAQPFDTLLQQYNTIEEIYPLADSSFILMGTGKDIVVERIDHEARVVWSLPVVSSTRDYLFDYRYDINASDSLIQIATVDKYCDVSYRSFFKIFTLNLNGALIDSQKVSFGIDGGRIFLLSGLPNRPRLAYINNQNVIVMHANGDTTQLELTWENGDTTNSYLIGSPRAVTMCPGGDILVGTTNAFVLFFRWENNHYNVVDASLGGGFKELLCLEDQYFISVSQHYLELWGNHLPLASFDFTDRLIERTTWRNPILTVQSFGFNNPDSVIFLSAHLELIHKEAKDNAQYLTMAIQKGITYKVGFGNTYFDQGQLLSDHQITHEGPKDYDVELTDFNIGPYVDVHWEYGLGNYYLYDVPHATVTLKNNCGYTINNITIHYGRTTGFCSDTTWERNLLDMNLQPGETKTYDLHDIFITKDYPENPSEKTCVYAIRPDRHLDDQFDDNQLCKKVDLITSSSVHQGYTIHHFPTIFQDEISFMAPENIEFDLTVFSYSGIPVFSSHANTTSGYSADLSFLPAGLYIFQFTLSASGQQYLEKILKY